MGWVDESACQILLFLLQHVIESARCIGHHFSADNFMVFSFGYLFFSCMFPDQFKAAGGAMNFFYLLIEFPHFPVSTKLGCHIFWVAVAEGKAQNHECACEGSAFLPQAAHPSAKGG